MTATNVRTIRIARLRTPGPLNSEATRDNSTLCVTPGDMLAELRDDNRPLAKELLEMHGLCDDGGDVATASLLETWIDETEQRTWFLFEAGRGDGRNAA